MRRSRRPWHRCGRSSTAIAVGRRPARMSDDEALVYDFSIEIIRRRAVSDATFGRVRDALRRAGARRPARAEWLLHVARDGDERGADAGARFAPHRRSLRCPCATANRPQHCAGTDERVRGPAGAVAPDATMAARSPRAEILSMGSWRCHPFACLRSAARIVVRAGAFAPRRSRAADPAKTLRVALSHRRDDVRPGIRVRCGVRRHHRRRSSTRCSTTTISRGR